MTCERDGNTMTVTCSGCGAKQSEMLTGNVRLLFVGWWGAGASDFYCPICWEIGRRKPQE
jgi:hypothetical protein